jgi:hypothetical protein
VPGGERAQIKISAFGQTTLAPAAHLLAQAGHFYSAWFSLGNGSNPSEVALSLSDPGEIRRNASISPCFTITELFWR